jgi:Tetratricopeptide repeat
MKRFAHTNAIVLVSLLCLMGTVSVSHAVATTDDWDYGRELFGKQQYAQAIPYLKKCVSDHPNSMTMNYYLAIALHKAGNIGDATPVYEKIVNQFPGSDACANSLSALRYLAPAFYRDHTKGAGSSQNNSLVAAGNTVGTDTWGHARQLPPRDKIPFKLVNNAKLVDVVLGGHGIKMAVDLKAAQTTIGFNQLKEIGITASTNKDGSFSDVNLSIGCGSVQLPSVPIKVVSEDTKFPILGGDFFNQYTTKIDPIGHQLYLSLLKTPKVTLIPESTSKSRTEEFQIHFLKEGDFIVVPVEVDTGSFLMYFNEPTQVTTFTVAQINLVNPDYLDMSANTTKEEVPADSYNIRTTTRTKIKQLRFGPIIHKFNLDADIVDWRSLRYQYIHWDSYARPLLGSDVYKGWTYDIDSLHQIITFSKGKRDPFSWHSNVK